MSYSNDDFTWVIGVVSGTTYTITTTDINTIKDAFDKWADVIVDNKIPNDSDFNDGKINVDVKFEYMDGNYTNTLAYASATSWVYTDSNNNGEKDLSEQPFPYSGKIRINTNQVTDMRGNEDQYKYTIIHEIGHIMTLVATNISRWNENPVVVYEDTSDSNKKKVYWNGTNALKYYRLYFNNSNLVGIPIEDMGNSSTISVNGVSQSNVYLNFHWEEDSRVINDIAHPQLDEELMTPISEGSNETPFSAISIGLLEDYGYEVNYLAGDTFKQKTIDSLIDLVKYYVRLNSDPFSSPYYIFSLTSDGDSVGVPTLQRGKYYVFERTDTGHPFNIGTGWKVNNGYDTGNINIKIKFISTSTSNQVDGVGSIVDDDSISFYIPIDYAGDIKYYCYSHSSMINSFTTNPICFYGFVNIMTDCGLKQIKDLKRGDMILTNDGYQPLTELDVGFNPSNKLLLTKLKTKDFIVKIPKDFFIENVPSEDVYVTKTHPLSVKITSAENDKDFEFLHLFVEELMQLGDGIEYVRKDSETKLYNLIFDNHYEISVGNMKFLSHHPNHNNGNKRLKDGYEINASCRTKKVYADENGIYFKIITLKDIIKQKPENITDKEYLASVLRFD